MRVRVPADVEMADRIFAGLTARQLAVLGAAGGLVLLAWVALGERVPLAVFAALAVPVAAVGLVWATTSPEGTTWEGLATAALRHFTRPRRRVLAPEGVPDSPSWAGELFGEVAPLDLPARKASLDGHLELGADGAAAVCRASAINFALRSEEEQRALVEGFGRLLHALDAPAQFVVRSNRADLRREVQGLEERAGALPHPGLERAAREHAGFLRALASRRDVLQRQVLVCLREPGGPSQTETLARLDHRAEEAAALLRGMGIRLARLEGEEAAQVLARACDPEGPPASGLAGAAGEVVEAAP